MNLQTLKQRPELIKKIQAPHELLNQFLLEVSKKDLPEKVILLINKEVNELNALDDTDKSLRSLIRKKQASIAKVLEKETQLVAKNYYRNLWLAIGMAAFGIPMGIVLGTSLNNMGFLGLGIPFGMLIGMAIGTKKDQAALAEGRQLDVELK